MKNKLTNAFNTILAFVKKHSIGTVVVALLITAVIVALACKETTEVAPGDKNTVSDVSTSSSEENVSQSTVSSNTEEATKPEVQDTPETNTSPESQDTNDKGSSEKNEDQKGETSSQASSKPTTSSGSGTASSEPAQPSQPSTGSGNTTVTTPGRPSDAALEYSGITYEEHLAANEAAQTCPLCGKYNYGNHHLYGRDMNCTHCGAPCKANTCHWCE